MKTSLRMSAILGLMILTGIPSALGMDDGGGRSVFARGAGERALSLGGAYVAMDGDPAMMVWNPAGLATVDRTSFYASSSNLIGLGFSERMGAIALPNWRLGVFGLAFRRFAVDGIEQRDDRATLGDQDLSDAENEIMIGFGRTLGGAWRLGLAAKYQQQTLAGFSDGALGLDMGVSVQPLRAMGLESPLARGLSLGMSIRNFMEPSLRLRDESVPDPTGVRLGAALATGLGRNLDLLLVADTDKTRDMDNQFHAGAELTLLRTLSLRCGSNDGMLTAGAGLKIRDLAFDYAFEDNIIAGVHRFGLRLAFGETSARKRRKALAAREKAFQSRLAAMFARQEESRIGELHTRILNALDQGDYLAARDLISTLRVLDPSRGDLDRLEARAYLMQARDKRDQGDFTSSVLAYQTSLNLDPGQTAARTELQAVRERNDQEVARSREMRQLLDQALESFAAGDLIQARDGFQAIINLDPNDHDARTFLETVRKSMVIKCENLADQAVARAQAGDFAAAGQALDEARRLIPDNAHLHDQARIVEKLQQQARAASAPAHSAVSAADGKETATVESGRQAPRKPRYADLPFKRQAEIGRLYREGVRALNENRREDAIRYWELVSSSAPDYQQVAENLKQEYLVQGMEAFAAGHLDQAISIWEKALEVVPGDERAQGYLARAYDHRARIKQLKAVGK